MVSSILCVALLCGGVVGVGAVDLRTLKEAIVVGKKEQSVWRKAVEVV